MKSIKRKNLDELARFMPVLSENEQRGYIGGYNVVITINRNNYSDASTMGYFSAAAYDDNGQFIAAITGVTLEPFSDMSLENVKNSGSTIAPGTYDVVSGTYHNTSGYYQVSGVDGRTGIFFHIGNYHQDSKGCILLGSSGYCNDKGNYEISGSSTTVQNFNDFLSKYGNNGIVLNIC